MISTVGWDVGGAHLKACLVEAGVARDAAQWPCPLWQGEEHLDRALDAACARWPAASRHAVTMTGEMVDLYADRERGVLAVGARLRARLGAALAFYAGDAGFVAHDALAQRWAQVASANWLATATLCAARAGHGVLVDIGSTTTDVVAFGRGAVSTGARSDAERLASGELVYHGVVRTPLCAIAQSVPWRGAPHNVMNEFFATSADVYRLTGELDEAHDQQPSADGGSKDAAATCRRLARMVGLDARDASHAEWLAFAREWRALQLAAIASQLERVIAARRVPLGAPLVAAGCGDFLVADLAAALARPVRRFASDVLGADGALARWAQVCAPSVAVALLLDAEAACTS